MSPVSGLRAIHLTTEMVLVLSAPRIVLLEMSTKAWQQMAIEI